MQPNQESFNFQLPEISEIGYQLLDERLDQFNSQEQEQFQSGDFLHDEPNSRLNSSLDFKVIFRNPVL